MTRISDADGQPFESEYGAMVQMPVEHKVVHDGMMYNAEYSATIANAAALDLSIIVGTKALHMDFAVITGGAATVAFYEAPTITVAGTAVTPVCQNRVKAAGLLTTFKHTPTVTGTGTTLFSRLTPGGTNPATQIGNEARGGAEWVLAPSTTYLIRVTNTSGGNAVVNPIIQCYERP